MKKHRIIVQHPNVVIPFTIHAMFDLHIGAGHSCCSIEELKQVVSSSGVNWVLGGDNFDVKGCMKKDLPLISNLIYAFQNYENLEILPGNHEAITGKDFPKYLVSNSQCLVHHGHRWDWDEEKCIKWENRKLSKCGKSKSTWYFKKLAYKSRKKGGFKKFSSIELERLDKYLEGSNISMSICGHYHKFGWDISEKGNLLVSCPRGFSEIMFMPGEDVAISCKEGAIEC